VAIEAAHPLSWHRWVGPDGVIIGIDRFGASAPYADIYKGLGLTVDRLVQAAKKLVAQ
jgi:transketolase